MNNYENMLKQMVSSIKATGAISEELREYNELNRHSRGLYQLGLVTTDVTEANRLFDESRKEEKALKPLSIELTKAIEKAIIKKMASDMVYMILREEEDKNNIRLLRL